MRIGIALCSALALAACGSDEAADTPAASASVTAEIDPADVGLFEVSSEGGATVMHRRAADGTFADIVEGEEVGMGTWRRNETGQMCFGQAEGDSQEACWTDSEPREDGSWISMSRNGETVNVRRIEELEAEG